MSFKFLTVGELLQWLLLLHAESPLHSTVGAVSASPFTPLLLCSHSAQLEVLALSPALVIHPVRLWVLLDCRLAF